MFLKRFVLYFFLIIFLNNCTSADEDITKPTNGLQVLKNAAKLVDTVWEITPYLNITIKGVPPNCVQILCKFVCFNGKSTEIDKDIDTISKRNHHVCSRVEELRLYNYEFSNKILTYGFLGNYSDKVEILYLASSNITDIEAGSFANGSFKEIYFENLQLTELRKDFFQGISNDFTALSIIQKEWPLKVIYSNFLSYVKYQIKSLTLQADLNSIRNLTGGDCLLNNLIYADFSHNDFGDQMEYTAFSKVSMVEHLDLSHSNLEYLPSYIFSDFSTTLDYLDISFNRLKTISRTIFGWREISRDLKIFANDNEWWCSCDLQRDMKEIFIYQRTSLVCLGPEEYKGWSVFDREICGLSSAEYNGKPTEILIESTLNNEAENIKEEVTTRAYEANIRKTTEMILTTTRKIVEQPTYVGKDDLMKLNCLLSVKNNTEQMPKTVQWPLIPFDVIAQENLQVDIVLDSPLELNESLGLIWFSKVTSDYYKMEINYNEYGLGCYKDISYVTSVMHLMPNTAYTFCVVLKGHLPISPFSCRSLHVRGNLAIQYSAWLTKDQQITGLSLVIFGIVMFSFAGIILIYLLLKRKPILLKGSKRVTTTHAKSNEIIVLPKDNSVKKIMAKEEEILARGGPFTSSQKRRNSIESVASYQSYINSNLYEVIPAYNKLSEQKSLSIPSSLYLEQSSIASTSPDTESCYLTPLETASSSANLVQYAQIPYRAKRISSDPLPEVPADHVSFSVEVNEADDKPEYAQVGTIYMLDCQV